MVRLLVLIWVFSLNMALGDRFHALPSLPSNLDLEVDSDAFETSDKGDAVGALMLRRYDDTKQLAQIIGARFDQNFVNRAFDFYSKNGLLKDNPNVSEAQIRSFLKEVGGIQDNEVLIKVGKAFVEQKKEEFLAKNKSQGGSEKTSNPGDSSNASPENRQNQIAKSQEPKPLMIPIEIVPNPNVALAPALTPPMTSSGISGVGAATPVAATGSDTPKSDLGRATADEVKSPLPKDSTPNIASLFAMSPVFSTDLPIPKPAQIERSLSPSEKSTFIEPPKVSENTSNGKDSSSISEPTSNLPKQSASPNNTTLNDSNPEKSFFSGTIAERIAFAKSNSPALGVNSFTQSPAAITNKALSPLPDGAMASSSLIPNYSTLSQASGLTSPIRVVPLDVGATGDQKNSSPSNGGTSSIVVTAGKRETPPQPPSSPSSLLDKFYQFFDGASENSSSDEPNRNLSFLNSVNAQSLPTAPLVSVRLEKSGANKKSIILLLVFSTLASIWLAWRVAESRRFPHRPAVEVLDNPISQYRDVNEKPPQ